MCGEVTRVVEMGRKVDEVVTQRLWTSPGQERRSKKDTAAQRRKRERKEK
jgi:hypothetical protein